MYDIDVARTAEALSIAQANVQIAFYISASAVAWLTFVVARKGLLSPVNTEYQKRVMDRLGQVADELGREWDPADPACYVRHNEDVDAACEDLRHQCEKYQQHQMPAPFIGIMVSPLETRLTEQFNRWRSDPFLPDELRHELLGFTVERANVYSKIYFSELGKYRKALIAGSKPSTHEVSNGIHKRLSEAGFGIDDVAAKVDVLRLKLRAYMQRFDPQRRPVFSARLYSPMTTGRTIIPAGSRLITIVGDEDTGV